MKKTLNDENFKQVTSTHEKPFMVEFFATWCPHCQRMAPIIDELAVDFEGKADIFVIDVDIAEKTIAEFKVSGTPTIVFFKENKPFKELVGEKPKQILVEILNEII
ncbi:Thioredoxin domain [Elusimicrobium minutum Pei191]|uniref:Thioredoxin n=1 Tax=Elusimicrobium minutum (strain Pei191) TaxID=445932 RepID=B2KDH3_ELUMP|nr:thioredoxin domain-containing protein [Elusimicrobium minutum]ACC98569.1 Thioredoxin domain [Elusimicrobium minutum Pei191]